MPELPKDPEHGLELLREHGYKPVVYEHAASTLEEALKKREPKALALTIRILDSISIWSGKLAAWLIVPMVLALCYEVVARYFFESPTGPTTSPTCCIGRCSC